MLGRITALAALLLAVASADVAAYAERLPATGDILSLPKNALPARASATVSASSAKPAASAECIKENWHPPLKWPSGFCVYAYANPTVWMDPDGRAPIFEDIQRRFHERATAASEEANRLRTNARGLEDHVDATILDAFEAAPFRVIAATFWLANTVADAGISMAAKPVELAGTQYPEYGVVSDARANVRGTARFITQFAEGLSVATEKLKTRDGRAELGTPLVEWSVALAQGDPAAAQALATGAGEVIIGGASLRGATVRPATLVQESRVLRGGSLSHAGTPTQHLGRGTVVADNEATFRAGTDIVQDVARQRAASGVDNLMNYMSPREQAAYLANEARGSRFIGQAVHNATADTLGQLHPGRFVYNRVGYDFLDTLTGEAIELTTRRAIPAHTAKPGYTSVNYVTYPMPTRP